MTDAPSTKDQTMQAAGTAADEGKHVAGVAADEARNVAGQAQAHVKGLLDEARVQADEQTRTQRDRAASVLQSFGDDLDTMATDGGTSGLAAELAQQAATRARALGQHLDGREPSDLLDDVRRFARQRPGAFLAGALLAGVVAGRLARGAKDAGSTSTTTGPTGTGAPSTPAAPTPYAEPLLTERTSTYDDPTVATPTVGTPGRVADPLGLDEPSLGAAVPPTSTGRYEP